MGILIEDFIYHRHFFWNQKNFFIFENVLEFFCEQPDQFFHTIIIIFHELWILHKIFDMVSHGAFNKCLFQPFLGRSRSSTKAAILQYNVIVLWIPEKILKGKVVETGVNCVGVFLVKQLNRNIILNTIWYMWLMNWHFQTLTWNIS